MIFNIMVESAIGNFPESSGERRHRFRFLAGPVLFSYMRYRSEYHKLKGYRRKSGGRPPSFPPGTPPIYLPSSIPSDTMMAKSGHSREHRPH
jgi:hypothetical protein